MNFFTVTLTIIPVLFTTGQVIFRPDIKSGNNTCVSPIGIHGRCRKITDCPYDLALLNYLNRTKMEVERPNQSIIKAYTDYLRNSHCGWDNTDPRVCCDTDLIPDIQTCRIEFGGISNRINAGTEAGINEFPWMALLINKKIRGRMAYYCGGALINDRYVLTAAHCFHEPEMYNMVFVRLGEHDIRTDIDCRIGEDGRTKCADKHIDIEIEEKIIHEKFEPVNLLNDIALIRLAEPVNYTDSVHPICLLDNSYEPATMENVMFDVAGWGKQGGAGNFSDVKLKITIPGTSPEDCMSKYRTLKPAKTITETQFCAGGQEGKDTCQGDSGSPVIALHHGDYNYLAGIVSYGLQKCGTSRWPGVYTRVSKYTDWIRSKMRP